MVECWADRWVEGLGFILSCIVGGRKFRFYYARDTPDLLYVHEPFFRVGVSVKIRDLLNALRKYARGEDFRIGDLMETGRVIYRRARGIGIMKWRGELQIEPMSEKEAEELAKILEEKIEEIKKTF